VREVLGGGDESKARIWIAVVDQGKQMTDQSESENEIDDTRKQERVESSSGKQRNSQ